MANDITSLLGSVITEDSLSDMSKTLGIPADQIDSVLGAAMPALLGGALDQANGDETAESFAGALSDHAADDYSDLGSFLSKVDLEDGEKIVNHLLGKDSAAVDEIAERSGVTRGNTLTILALMAPLLMSMLGQQTQQQQQQNSALGVSGILGSLMGLGGTQQTQQSSGLLGSLLGGGTQTQQSSGLLGGLLGGNTQQTQQQSSSGLLGLLSSLLK